MDLVGRLRVIFTDLLYEIMLITFDIELVKITKQNYSLEQQINLTAYNHCKRDFILIRWQGLKEND